MLICKTRKNPRESEVLNIACAAAEPLTSTQIVDAQKGLTQSTVIAVLRRLAARDMVEVVGVTHSGKVLSRTYAPGPKEKEEIKQYYADEFAMTKDILFADDLREIVARMYGQTKD